MTPVEHFNDLVNRFYDDYFRFNPILGREMGFNRYAGRVPDLSYEIIMGFLKRLQFYHVEINRLMDEDLSQQQKADLVLMELTVNYERFSIQRLRWGERDPMQYTFMLDISGYIKRNYAPLETRLQHIVNHLSKIPELLIQQRYNLKLVQPKVNLETAIEMYHGYIDFFSNEVTEAFSESNDAKLIIELKHTLSETVTAIEEFLQYTEDILLPAASNEFAIGRFNFLDLLRFGEMVDIDLSKLIEIGEGDLEKNKKLFEETADKLMPGKQPHEVMSEISKDHPTSENLIDETRNMLEDIRKFLIDKDILTVPSEERIKVDETPSFLRYGFAMCDVPGPFEKTASESFYYVTNVHPDWSEKEKEEWLTKFDYATLDNISVHEAYPGHYVHYLHTKSAPSKVSKIFGAYSFWEGWAHYAEEMMLKEGWHENDLKFKLAQLSEALLRNSRFICAIKMHALNMSVQEATTFIMENAYMAETPAKKEADRGTFDPAYLNYTLGKLMILKLQDDWKKQEGDSYSLKRFHDTFLSFGAPPIPLVRKLMLKEDNEVLF